MVLVAKNVQALEIISENNVNKNATFWGFFF